jgi:2-dehydro-3-deoxyphosphogluconate aldolase/(4S)-4-hydroxy-2-oxoglutarate aldolase
MSRKELLSRIYTEQIIGVVRENTAEAGEAVAEAYARNGIQILEITLTTPDAIDLIAALAKRYAPHITIAAGTVRSPNDAALARRAGAEVLVSPHTDTRVIEIIQAWEAGCDIVKVYPAQHLGGPDYIRTIRGPIRDVPMLAGGPVPLDMIDAYLDAGCVAVNLGASLAVPDLVKSGQWDEIGRRAILATSIVQSRRNLEQPETPYVH